MATKKKVSLFDRFYDLLVKLNNVFKDVYIIDRKYCLSGKESDEEALGDIVISIEKVKEQAEEYGHSFERELAYMVVHGFYHLMGYDHIGLVDRTEMRAKEETVLNKLNITRE